MKIINLKFKIKNIGLFFLLLVVNLVLVLPVFATSHIYNPAPNYFFDFTGKSQQNTFENLIFYIVQILLGLVAMVAMAFLVWGGFEYITARGDETRAESGKKTIRNSILGLVIVILSYMIVVVIINALRGNP